MVDSLARADRTLLAHICLDPAETKSYLLFCMYHTMIRAFVPLYLYIKKSIYNYHRMVQKIEVFDCTMHIVLLR